MTISYNLDVASASPLNFFRLILRWKGSIWKICLKELLIWTVCFLSISFVYRGPYILTEEQKRVFEEIAVYFDTHLQYIPLTFMLGFFVQTIVKRWSVLFQNMGFIEGSALYIAGYIYGTDEECRLLRRTIARYLCLTQLLVYRDISVSVRKRFPTYDSIIKGGFMLEHEKEKLESLKLDYNKYWVPINWAYGLIFIARDKNWIVSDSFANKLCDQIKFFRNNLQMLCNYDWVPIPLAYPQLVFLAVYVYFAICLISRQFIVGVQSESKQSNVDLAIPFVTMMEFLIFVGWMKVAEGLLNPFGDDDDDFECNYLLDKNLATALCIVDDSSNDTPELIKDKFWWVEKIEPIYPAHSLSNIVVHPLVGSATLSDVADIRKVEMVSRNSIGNDNLNQSTGNNIRPRSISVSKLEDKFGRRNSYNQDYSTSLSKKFLRRISAFASLDDYHGNTRTRNDSIELGTTGSRSSLDSYRENLSSLPKNPVLRSTEGLSSCSSLTSKRRSIVLSTVQEEDPNNLTVTNVEQPRTSVQQFFVSCDQRSSNQQANNFTEAVGETECSQPINYERTQVDEDTSSKAPNEIDYSTKTKYQVGDSDQCLPTEFYRL